MKKNELKRIIKTDILPFFEDFYQKSDMLIYKNSNEILKGISFDISSFGKVSCTLFIQPLFVPFDEISFMYSLSIRDEDNRQWWDLNGEILQVLIDKIKQNEAFLIDANNSCDFYKVFKDNSNKSIRFREGIAYASCYSNNESYKQELSDLASMIKDSDLNYNWLIDCLNRAEKLLSMEYEEAFAILVEWLNFTKTNLKLD